MKTSQAGSSSVQTGKDGISVRALTTHADFVACVQLQRDTWGTGFSESVPASILKVSRLIGGVSGGAFTPEGRMVGFVYGLTGVREGRLIHWSHMLAVAADLRNHGIGRRLKEFQREVVRGLGIEVIYWTFDPLVARNAHLNLNCLEAQVQEYVPDMYGDTGSDLHAFGTDRLVVSWEVAPTARKKPGTAISWRTAPVMGREGVDGARIGSDDPAAVVRIEIPPDVELMALEEAQTWRNSTRPAFLRLLRDGYQVTGFVSNDREGCFYLLTRPSVGDEGRGG
jgi:predicted GNAT superfamily acetyltransferase